MSEDNFRRRTRAADLAEKRGYLPVQIALPYVLCQPFSMFALIGPRTIHEMRTALRAFDIQLTPQEVEWLRGNESLLPLNSAEYRGRAEFRRGTSASGWTGLPARVEDNALKELKAPEEPLPHVMAMTVSYDNLRDASQRAISLTGHGFIGYSRFMGE